MSRYKILCASEAGTVTDEFHTSLPMSHQEIADTVRQVYEGRGIDVIGVIKVAEIELDIL